MPLLLLLLLFLPVGAVFAQPAPPRLIVRGDDMGYAHGGNEAILQSYREGIMTSVEVIVPSPWFPEAVRMLAEHPDLDVGVHLALSSEWDYVKWRPLTESPSLRDPDGYFFPMIYPNPNYPGRALAENDWKLADIEKEFRAQIETALEKIPGVSHVSAHMGCTNLTEEVKALAKQLAREYGIDIDPQDYGAERAGFDGPSGTAEEKIESFIRMLDGLEPGKTYLFVEHPGLDTPELRAIHHIGYEDVAVDRQGVTDTWTSPRVRAAIREKGIELISYAGLKAGK